MKRSEIAQILTMAKALDDRVTVDEARVLAWELALHPAMTLDIAKNALGSHYSSSDRPIMPVHLNEYYKAQRRSERQISPTTVQGVPPTPEYLEAVSKLRGKQ